MQDLGIVESSPAVGLWDFMVSISLWTFASSNSISFVLLADYISLSFTSASIFSACVIASVSICSLSKLIFSN